MSKDRQGKKETTSQRKQRPAKSNISHTQKHTRNPTSEEIYPLPPFAIHAYSLPERMAKSASLRA
jgi:hypothetical protein